MIARGERSLERVDLAASSASSSADNGQMIVAYRSFLSAMCFNRGKTPTGLSPILSSSPPPSPPILWGAWSAGSGVYRRATLNFGSFAYQIRRRINTRRLLR